MPSRIQTGDGGFAIRQESCKFPGKTANSASVRTRFVHLFENSHAEASAVDADQARVMDAWPALPENIKVAMLALAATARPADIVAVQSEYET
jgi:hypothetical protein